MLVSQLSDLPPIRELAIIVNASTKQFTTLALLSTLRYARIPTLVIDCDSVDGSRDWFCSLMRDHEFYLMSARLLPHGETLDRVFRDVSAERLLLVDSDIEVITTEMVDKLRAMIAGNEQLYGSGSLQRACWFQYHYPTDLPVKPGIGYFMERPWIPFTLLRVEPVQRALASGHSFNYRLRRNEFPSFPRLSYLLWRRFKFRIFRERRLFFLDVFREKRAGVKPAYFFYDTGADVHEYLTHDLGYEFGAVDPGLVPWSVTHFEGVTRSVIEGNSVSRVQALVQERLAKEYGLAM